MLTAAFQGHGVLLAALACTGTALGLLAHRIAVRRGSGHRPWWFALTATLTVVVGVTSFGGGRASGECVVNHDLAEPFHTAQDC